MDNAGKKRAEAERLVKENGGTIISGVKAKLNILVVGEDAGSKLENAKKLGTVKLLTEKDLKKMVPGNTVVSAPKAKSAKAAAPQTATTAPAAKTNGIAGKSFYIQDIFTMKNLSTSECEDIVEDTGGIVAEIIDRNLDYLMHNTKRSDMSALMVTHLMGAKELGVKVINEAQLLKLASQILFAFL